MADTHFDGVVCNKLSSATDTDTSITFDAGGSITFDADGTLYLGLGGLLILSYLPTADPGVGGALWNDAGTLKISAG